MTAPLRHDDRSDGAAAPQPFFLAGAAGPLFCLQLAPAPGMTPRGALLYLPPFAEEANRSRRMAVLQARRLAARGWPVLLLDPFGTGDSAGAFHEARWELWLDDAARAADEDVPAGDAGQVHQDRTISLRSNDQVVAVEAVEGGCRLSAGHQVVERGEDDAGVALGVGG